MTPLEPHGRNGGAGLVATSLVIHLSALDPASRYTLLTADDSHAELAHYISDLGGVLGQTRGLLYARGELPNAFPWTFTRPPLWQGPHKLALPLRLQGYKPIAQAAFGKDVQRSI